MSACSEILFLGWLLLMGGSIVIQSIEAASTLPFTRNNNQDLKISAADDKSICTTNGIDYVLFYDQSRLDEANRKRQATEAAYEKVSMGFCQTQCNLVCPTVSLPICAVDAVTGLQRSFNNPCEMSRDACLNNIAWKLHTTDQCSAMQEKTKPILIEPEHNPTETGRKPVSCIKVFNPVCAIFAGVKSTFNNECLVNAEKVKTGNDWTIFSHGVCAEDYGSFGYSADQNKYNNIRSFGKSIYNEKPRETDRYYDDMTFIYTPPIIQTEYIDEAFAENLYDPPKALRSSNNQHQLRYPFKTHVQAKKPIHLIDNHNELGRVIRCKFDSEPICGTYKNRYRSFDNVCELMLRNILLNQTWTTAYAGFCIKKKCPQVCTEEYAPICVSKNGVNLTISNLCQLDMKQCHDPQSTWKILAKGQCENKTLASTTTLPSTEKYHSDGLGSRIGKISIKTTIAPPTSRTSYKHITTKISEKTTTTKSPTTPMSPTKTTTMAEIKTTATTTTMHPSTTTTTSKPTTSLTFDTQKSLTTPKHYVSLTTSETTKTTTLSPYHSTTTTPVTTFVISAKIAPFTSSRTSIYGANRNSIIMRLAKAKAFASRKHFSASSFSSLTSS